MDLRRASRDRRDRRGRPLRRVQRAGAVRTPQRVAVMPALIAALFAVLVGSSGAVLAHSGLGAASPAPGAVVGGEINDIQLRYASSVGDVTGSVTDPDGNVLATVFEQNSNLAISIELAEPLSVPGEYAVRHISTDLEDSDRVEAAYLFTYDPTAPPPRLEILDVDEGGFPWTWVIRGIGAVVIGFLAWRLVVSMRQARVVRPENSNSTTTDSNDPTDSTSTGPRT